MIYLRFLQKKTKKTARQQRCSLTIQMRRAAATLRNRHVRRRYFWQGPDVAAQHFLQGVVEGRRPGEDTAAFKRHTLMRRSVEPSSSTVVDLVLIGGEVSADASVAPGQAAEPVVEIELSSLVDADGMIITAQSSEHSSEADAFVSRFEMEGEPYAWTRSVGITQFAAGGRSMSEAVFTDRGMQSFVDLYDADVEAASMCITTVYSVCDQSEWEEARQVLEAA